MKGESGSVKNEGLECGVRGRMGCKSKGGR
jgi:hypothetical protein